LKPFCHSLQPLPILQLTLVISILFLLELSRSLLFVDSVNLSLYWSKKLLHSGIKKLFHAGIKRGFESGKHLSSKPSCVALMAKNVEACANPLAQSSGRSKA